MRCFGRGEDVSQLVKHWTSMLLTQVRFPGVAGDISPRVNFQHRLSYGVHVYPHVQLHAFTSVCTLKIL